MTLTVIESQFKNSNHSTCIRQILYSIYSSNSSTGALKSSDIAILPSLGKDTGDAAIYPYYYAPISALTT
jgi:hypothetical protein